MAANTINAKSTKKEMIQYIAHLEGRLEKAKEVFYGMKASQGGMQVGEVKRIDFRAPKGKVTGKVLVELVSGKDKTWITYLTLTGKGNKGDFNMPIESAKYMGGRIRKIADNAVGNVFRPKDDRR